MAENGDFRQGGSLPLGHLRRGGGSISALRVTGDPAKGDPGGEASRSRPPRRDRQGGPAANAYVRSGQHDGRSIGYRGHRQSSMPPLTPLHHLQQHPGAGSQGVGIATLIFRYFLRYFSSTHRTDLSRFRGTFHSFDPVGFAIFAIPTELERACPRCRSVRGSASAIRISSN